MSHVAGVFNEKPLKKKKKVASTKTQQNLNLNFLFFDVCDVAFNGGLPWLPIVVAATVIFCYSLSLLLEL